MLLILSPLRREYPQAAIHQSGRILNGVRQCSVDPPEERTFREKGILKTA